MIQRMRLKYPETKSTLPQRRLFDLPNQDSIPSYVTLLITQTSLCWWSRTLSKTKKWGTVKSVVPVSIGSKLSIKAQLKRSVYFKELFYFALETFSKFIWQSEKPMQTLTHSESSTSFFQTKATPPSFWTYADRVSAFNITVDHLLGKLMQQ